jgi:predicted esterase
MNSTLRSVVINPSATHTCTVLFLHGLGDSGNGWSDVGKMFSPKLPNVKFIFPHAPQRSVTLNMGMKMPAWYDIFSLDKSDQREDEKGMFETTSQINELIKQEIDSGIPANKIILGGFSQGGAMTLLTGLTTDFKLAGLICMSGYLPLGSKIHQLRHPENKIPIFMAHGTADQVVALKWGEASFEKIRKLGYEATFQTYQGLGHSANDKELGDVLNFIIHRFQ